MTTPVKPNLLANHIAALKEFLHSESADRLSEALASDTLTGKDLRSLIPEELLALSVAITTDGVYEDLVDKSPSSFRDDLAAVRNDVLRRFGPIIKVRAVREIIEGSKKSSWKRRATLFNRIDRISLDTFLRGTPPKIMPMIKVGLFNMQGKRQLDTFQDWDDLLWLASSFIEKVAEDVSSTREMYASGWIADEEVVEVTQRLAELRQKIAGLEQSLDEVVAVKPKLAKNA